MPYYLGPPPQNPLTRIIATIIAALTLVGAIMLGLVALLVIAGLALVAGLAIWARVAWIKRQLRKSGVNLGPEPGVSRQSGHIIDAEYTVVPDSSDQKDE
jgi:hypothetical protein